VQFCGVEELDGVAEGELVGCADDVGVGCGPLQGVQTICT
jgi:hypothetical protein